MFHAETAAKGVSVFRMDDGKVNAMGQEFVSGFLDPWEQAVSSGEPIVLVGNDRVFSAGLDLKALPTLDRGELASLFDGFVRMAEAVVAAPVPVVAAVNGPAIAGGAVLAFAADIRVVGDASRMALTEVAVGVDFPPPEFELCRAALPRCEHGPAFLEAVERAGGELVDRGWAHHHVPGAGAAGEASVLGAAVERAGRAGDHHGPTFAAVKSSLRAELIAAHERFTGEAVEAYVDGLLAAGTLDRVSQALARVTGRS